MIRRRLALQSAAALALLAGCAGLPWQQPVNVQVVDLQALDGQALELRFLCVLRVQNPNDHDIRFSGVALDLQVRGSPFATGVSDIAGTLPRYGEVLVAVPVSASAMNMARVAIGLFLNERPRLDYVLRGHVGSARFESSGELTLPVRASSAGTRS